VASSAGNAPRRAQILAAATTLLEAGGRDAVTMRAIAEQLGVKAPSLYKHVRGKDEVEDALVTAALEELGGAVADAARRAHAPLPAMAAAYRAFARRHPSLYRLLTERPLPAGHRPGPREAEATALLADAVGGRDQARAAWAFVHGMTQLEAAGRFPPEADVNGAWLAGLAAFAATREPDGGDTVPARELPRAVVRSWRGPD
jgi:AcrR family transcriptional regulator